MKIIDPDTEPEVQRSVLLLYRATCLIPVTFEKKLIPLNIEKLSEEHGFIPQGGTAMIREAGSPIVLNACRTTKIYCRPGCPPGRRTKPENRVHFNSRVR